FQFSRVRGDEGPQLGRRVRTAGGGDHGPAVAQHFLHHTKPDATIGTDNNSERRISHGLIFSGTTQFGYFCGSTTTVPTLPPCSTDRCAAAVWYSGNVPSTDRIRPGEA